MYLCISGGGRFGLHLFHNLLALLDGQSPLDAFLATLVQSHGEEFHLLGTWDGPVHGLAQDLDGKSERLGNVRDADLLLGIVVGLHLLVVVVSLGLGPVLRLEEGLAGLVVGPDDGGLPPGVVAGGVGLVQLEAVVGVVSGEEEGDAEGSEAAVLGIGLLVVADVLDELLDGDGLGVLVGVPTGAEAGLVDEDVGIGGQAGHGAGGVVAELVGLLGGFGRGEEAGRDALLAGHDDAVLGQDADAGAGVVDGLDGILDLVEPTLGAEGCGGCVVPTGHDFLFCCSGCAVFSVTVTSPLLFPRSIPNANAN